MTATASSTSGTLDEHVRGGVIGGARTLAGLLWLANLHWKVPPDFGESSNSGLYKRAIARAHVSLLDQDAGPGVPDVKIAHVNIIPPPH